MWYIRIFVRIIFFIRIYSDNRSFCSFIRIYSDIHSNCFFDTNIFGYSFISKIYIRHTLVEIELWLCALGFQSNLPRNIAAEKGFSQFCLAGRACLQEFGWESLWAVQNRKGTEDGLAPVTSPLKRRRSPLREVYSSFLNLHLQHRGETVIMKEPPSLSFGKWFVQQQFSGFSRSHFEGRLFSAKTRQ